MDCTPQQRYFMLVGRLVVEDGMCADEAQEIAVTIWGALIGIQEQNAFEAAVQKTIDAL